MTLITYSFKQIMNYYINNNIIHETEAILSFEELNQEQIARYLADKNSGVYYVLNGETPVAQEYTMDQLADIVYVNYEKAETSNLTPAGAIQLDK
jgi:hypothetical protein